MQNLSKTHIILLELLELINNKPISLYLLEKETKRKFITIKKQIEFLELLELIEVIETPKGKTHHYEITITDLGLRVKEKINFNLHQVRLQEIS